MFWRWLILIIPLSVPSASSTLEREVTVSPFSKMDYDIVPDDFDIGNAHQLHKRRFTGYKDFRYKFAKAKGRILKRTSLRDVLFHIPWGCETAVMLKCNVMLKRSSSEDLMSRPVVNSSKETTEGNYNPELTRDQETTERNYDPDQVKEKGRLDAENDNAPKVDANKDESISINKLMSKLDKTLGKLVKKLDMLVKKRQVGFDKFMPEIKFRAKRDTNMNDKESDDSITVIARNNNEKSKKKHVNSNSTSTTNKIFVDVKYINSINDSVDSDAAKLENTNKTEALNIDTEVIKNIHRIDVIDHVNRTEVSDNKNKTEDSDNLDRKGVNDNENTTGLAEYDDVENDQTRRFYKPNYVVKIETALNDINTKLSPLKVIKDKYSNDNTYKIGYIIANLESAVAIIKKLFAKVKTAGILPIEMAESIVDKVAMSNSIASNLMMFLRTYLDSSRVDEFDN